MSNSPIDELARLRAAATQGEWLNKPRQFAKDNETLLYAGGGQDIMVRDARTDGYARDNHAFVVFAANNTAAIVAERDEWKHALGIECAARAATVSERDRLRQQLAERDAEIKRIKQQHNVVLGQIQDLLEATLRSKETP